MKDFDLAAAKRGATVCTRCGCLARILCFDSNMASDEYATPIVAEVVIYGRINIMCYTAKGGLDIEGQSKYDLMMADDDYLEKLERGEYDHIGEAAEKVGDSRSMGGEVVENNRRFISMWYEDMKRKIALEQLRKTVEDLKSGATSNKDKTTENWDYWRMKYAGDIMSHLIGSDKLSGLTFDIISREVRQMADALVEELKKTHK